MKRRFYLTLVICLGIILLSSFIVAGCAKTTPTPVSGTTTAPPTISPTLMPQRGGTLTLLWRGASGSVGWPALGPSGEMIHTAQFFYEALVKDTHIGGILKYEPWLATSWDLAADGKSITFQLRKGVKFHDGTDFNAEAVKWNYDQLIEAGKRPNWASVDIIDPYTVIVNLKQWQNLEMYNFTNTSYIVSPTAFKEKGGDWLEVNPVGTGPFIFESFELDVMCKGVRNPGYWQKDDQGNQLPYLDAIEVKYVPEWSARKVAMQTGEGDMTVGELGKETYDMESLGFKVYKSAESVFTILMSGANPNSPFANQKVREAVEYAIDREALAAGLGFGQWVAPYQLVPRVDSSYDPNFVGRKYNLEKAKELLKEAGFENGFSTTLYPIPGSSDDCATAVQDALGKVGITVEIVKWEPGRFFQFFTGQTWEGMVIATMPTNGNYNFGLLYFFSGMMPMYVSSLITPELEAAVMESINSREMDISLIRKVIQVIYNQCLVIPLYESGLCVATYDYVQGGGIGQRGLVVTLNPETFWLNK